MKSAAPHANGIGQPVRRKEDLRLVRGAGRYSDDLESAASGLCHRAALAACACAHRPYRYRRGARSARRALRVDRHRGCGRRPQADPARFSLSWQFGVPALAARPDLAEQGRQPDLRQPLSAAGAATACAISARRWPWWSRRRWPRAQGRGRADRDRLRAAAGGHRHRRGRRAGCAAPVGPGAVQYLPRCGGRRQGGNGRRLRARRARRRARDLGAARHRRADGSRAPRSAAYDSADRALHALCRQRRGRCASSARSRQSSACRSMPCTSSPRISAAISAPRIRSFPEYPLVLWAAGEDAAGR